MKRNQKERAIMRKRAELRLHFMFKFFAREEVMNELGRFRKSRPFRTGKCYNDYGKGIWKRKLPVIDE